MALPTTLRAFRDRLDAVGYSARTVYQDKLLEELNRLDGMIMQKSIEESTFASQTRMTSPDSGSCPCCGR